MHTFSAQASVLNLLGHIGVEVFFVWVYIAVVDAAARREICLEQEKARRSSEVAYGRPSSRSKIRA